MSPMFGHSFYPNFKRPIPPTKETKPVNTLRPRDSFCFLLVSSQSKEGKSPANVRAPSVISSDPLPKRPENPSGATAGDVVVGRVHRGLRRDQLLDHGGMTVPSRPMQRRLASGAEDATRTAGQLRLPSRNKAYQMGCFSGLLGKNCGYRS